MMRGLRVRVRGLEQLRQGVSGELEKIGTPQLGREDVSLLFEMGSGREWRVIPFSAHEHVAAVDGNEVHL